MGLNAALEKARQEKSTRSDSEPNTAIGLALKQGWVRALRNGDLDKLAKHTPRYSENWDTAAKRIMESGDDTATGESS